MSGPIKTKLRGRIALSEGDITPEILDKAKRAIRSHAMTTSTMDVAEKYTSYCIIRDEQLAEQIEKTRAAEDEAEKLKLKFAPLLALGWIGHTQNAQLTAMSNDEGLRLIKRAIYALHTKPRVEADLAALRSSQAGLLEAARRAAFISGSMADGYVYGDTVLRGVATALNAAIALAQGTPTAPDPEVAHEDR